MFRAYQEMRERICHAYIDGQMSTSEWRFQWNLVNVLIDQDIAAINATTVIPF